MPRVRRYAEFRQLTPFERGRIIGLREGGLSFRDIARRTNRSVSTIVGCWRAWNTERRETRARGSGRPRGTTEAQDRYLRLLAFRDRHMPTRRVAAAFHNVEGRPITGASIYRRIRSFGLRSYRPHLVLPLTAEHRRQRLEWCRERLNWDLEWNTVVFSDESRFCLGSHDGRQMVRRLRGERRNPSFSVERHVARTVGVMVWGAICYGSRSPLIFIQGSMTARRYIDVVLDPAAIPYVQGIANAMFQQDNARPHIARISVDHLEQANVRILPWPPRSPDLSPIEHVWDMMGRRLNDLPHQPETLQQLRHEIQIIWDVIDQINIDNLIRSMPRRVAECSNLRGGPTHY